MTDEEVNKIIDKIEKLQPDNLKRVDKEFDRFITTIGESLSAYADAHKAEVVMLGKTLIIVATDDIVKRKQAEPIGALSVIGNKENVAALYRALGERLKEQGVLDETDL